jgi:hypothetical protein
MEDESLKNRLEGMERILKVTLILIFMSLTCSLAALAIALAVLLTAD